MKELPLNIGQELFIRSTRGNALKTKSKIIGARHGHYILIEDPLYRVNERLYTPLTGTVYCQYFNENNLYLFYSQVLKALEDDITSLAYPDAFETKTVRQHHRISVNIEALYRCQNAKEPLKASILDISKGGCRLAIPRLLPLANDMFCELSFALPDGQTIRRMVAKIRDIRFNKLRNTTQLGLEFVEPPEELSKIESFTHYCMFFRT